MSCLLKFSISTEENVRGFYLQTQYLAQVHDKRWIWIQLGDKGERNNSLMTGEPDWGLGDLCLILMSITDFLCGLSQVISSLYASTPYLK